MSVTKKITLTHIVNVLRSAVSESRLQPRPHLRLGRWGTHVDKHKVDLKVMYSNEDHCGVCKEYITTKQKNIEAKQIKINKDEQLLNDELIWLFSSTPDVIQQTK